MAVGLAVDLLFLGILAWAGGVLWLAVGYIGLQLGSNIVHGPAQGLIPDQVPKEQLGSASGIKNLLDMIGLTLASLLMGRIFMLESPLPRLTILIAALVLILSAAITFLSAGEAPTLPDGCTVGKRPVFRAFHIDWRSQRGFAVLIASRFFFLVAIYGIQGFIQYFIRDVITAENPVRLTGDLLAAITSRLWLSLCWEASTAIVLGIKKYCIWPVCFQDWGAYHWHGCEVRRRFSRLVGCLEWEWVCF